MAEMEGIKREAEEEQVDDYRDHLELKLNEDITLDQPELLTIYACVYWAKESNGRHWNESEIREMIGHAMLKFDDDKYEKFDLKYLLETFQDINHETTKGVKVRAEEVKDHLVKRIKKLAYQQKYDSLVNEETRKEPHHYPSIDEVLAESSGGGQGDRGRGKSGQQSSREG